MTCNVNPGVSIILESQSCLIIDISMFVQSVSHMGSCGFFFQAEDGIRDLVRSRGLGDVYKRQGKEGNVPRIDKIGSTTWSTLKQKTKKNVKEVAYLSLIHI